MADEFGSRSVTRSRKTFAVTASPFNAVKLDLGILLAGGVLVLLIAGATPGWTGVALAVAYGSATLIWLVTRTRRVLRSRRALPTVENR